MSGYYGGHIRNPAEVEGFFSEHGTSEITNELIARLIFSKDIEKIKENTSQISIYDPCCGTASTLFTCEKFLKEINPKLKIFLNGQEINQDMIKIAEKTFEDMQDNSNKSNFQENLKRNYELITKGAAKFHKKVVQLPKQYNFKNSDTLISDKFENQKFDYLITCPPFGLQFTDPPGKTYLDEIIKNDSQKRFIKNEDVLHLDINHKKKLLPKTSEIFFLKDMLSKTKQDSKIAFLCAPSFSRSQKLGDIEAKQELIAQDLIECIIMLPSGVYKNTKLRPHLYILSKNKDKKKRDEIQMIDASNFSLDSNISNRTRSLDNIKKIVKLYQYSKPSPESIITKFHIDDRGWAEEEFLYSYFEEIFRIEKRFNDKRIKSYCSQKGIKTTNFKNCILSKSTINLLKGKKDLYFDKIKDKKNYVYFPTIPGPKTNVEYDVKKLKQWRYIAVEINDKKSDPKFICDFYNSKIGKTIIDGSKTGDYMPSLSKNAINGLLFAEKSIIEQQTTTKQLNKLEKMKEEIKKLEEQLIKDPNIPVKSPLTQIADDNPLLTIINTGETKTVEFKSTFSTPYGRIKDSKMNPKELQKEIEGSSLKTITGFLNTQGGMILIGVADDKKIIGIEKDKFENEDKYVRNISEKIKTRIGNQFSDKINIKIEKVNYKSVCVIECRETKKEAFFDDEFYIRTGARTDKLAGSRMLDYIKQRNK